MHTVTIKAAKAHLNQLVAAAMRGESVVLMRGARHVAAIIPISSDDLELAPHLTDAQAAKLWAQVREERSSGRLQYFATPAAAVRHLASDAKRGGRRSRRSRA